MLLCCCSVTKSYPTLCDPMDCSTPDFPVLHYPLEFVLTPWFSDTFEPSRPVAPFSSCPQSFPASGSFPVSQLFTSGGQSIGASTSASVLPMNIQAWFPLGLTGWLPCSPRASQESSPTPQFESLSSSAFSLLYGPTRTSVHDYWKNHSFDYMELCR